MSDKVIYLPDVVGGGYRDFWTFRGRYRVVKGSRASKKSKTMALWLIYNIMRHKGANALVVRKTYRSLKDSCYTELQWATERLGVSDLWKFSLSPLEVTYLPTNQKIYFRGLDDPQKVASITVASGALCWAWIEEAYEIDSEKDFDHLDETIRGRLPEDLYHQITLTLNPWNERHWIKRRFFDVTSDETLALTTNYKVNEFLCDQDRALFERMKERNPRRYQVAGLGDWGVVEGLVYENWEVEDYTLADLPDDAKIAVGLDYGYSTDPSALMIAYYSPSERKVWIWEDWTAHHKVNREIAEEIKRRGYAKERIIADSAEGKSNEELRRLGLRRVQGATKGPDTVRFGVQWLQDQRILVHPRCKDTVTELATYAWKQDHLGNYTGKPVDKDNHLLDALRYALSLEMQGRQDIDLAYQRSALSYLGV